MDNSTPGREPASPPATPEAADPQNAPTAELPVGPRHAPETDEVFNPLSRPAPQGDGAQRAPDTDEVYNALGATRVVSDALGDDLPSDADSSGSSSEVRRNVQGRQGAGQLGDFRLLKKLGEGAMGTVYKAHQLSFNRIIALKVLFKHVATNAKLVERFYREARVAGRLDHPNLVRGYEVGEDGGWHYFAMEYVPGKSLQKVLTTLGRLTVPDALYVALRAARGLQYAHEEGLVHRDVKPDNILITGKGEVKVGDLGMVKQMDEEMSLTQTGHAVGTPWYMPLEQARNAKDANARCDVYALGCVLYALLTGQPPFAGPTLVEVIQAKERGIFTPARRLNREVPERLDDIIYKMTAKQPQNRYASCAEAVRDLEALGLAGAALGFLAPTAVVGDKQPGAKPEVVAPSQPTPMPAQAGQSADVWYLRFKNRMGQSVQRKLTTAQVLELIEGEAFDPAAARASHSPGEGFRTLATYREFEPLVLGRATRSGADRKSSHYRKRFKEIEEEEERKHARPEAGPVTNAGYWLGIALRVGALAVAVGGVVLVVRWLIALAGS